MSNLKLIVTWDVHRVGLRMCVIPPSDGWVWAEFSWAVPCAGPPGPPGCQQWGHWGLEQQLFLKQCMVENKAWILQRGKVHVSFFSVIYFYFYLWSQFLPSMKSLDWEPYPWCRWKMMQCWHSLCLSCSCVPPSTLPEGLLHQACAGIFTSFNQLREQWFCSWYFKSHIFACSHWEGLKELLTCHRIHDKFIDIEYISISKINWKHLTLIGQWFCWGFLGLFLFFFNAYLCLLETNVCLFS